MQQNPDNAAAWVEKKARQLFSDADLPEVQQLLQEYGINDWEREAGRVRLALLKLSDGDLKKLRYWLEVAHQDYRDVLVGAEYPAQIKLDSWNLDEAGRRELKPARERDLQQLRDWLDEES